MSELEKFHGLEGQRVILTGACGGIGRVITEVLNYAGVWVEALDLQPESGMSHLDRVRYHRADVTEELTPVFEKILADAPECSTLIHTVGGAVGETFTDLDLEIWQREIELNLTSAYRCIRGLIEHFKQQSSTSIVVVSSVNAYTYYGNPAYSAAKAGLNSLVRSVATEFGEMGIRCNAVCPGSVQTVAWNHRIDRDAQVLNRVKEHYPMGRIVRPVDVAYAVAFLISPFAAGITGISLPVDCGLGASNFSMFKEIMN